MQQTWASVRGGGSTSCCLSLLVGTRTSGQAAVLRYGVRRAAAAVAAEVVGGEESELESYSGVQLTEP